MRGSLPGKTVDNFGGNGNLSDSSFLYDRVRLCPVCRREFKAKTVRHGKAINKGTDLDLRPRPGNIDALKYIVLECPVCGYADLAKFFSNVTAKELEILKNNSLKWDTNAFLREGERDYQTAYTYFKSAIRSNLVRGSKNGKRALTALYTSWILRGWRESMISAGKEIRDEDQMSLTEERKLIKYAFNNFRIAETTEEFPICGIDEPTFDYLMAAIAYELGSRNEAGKYIIKVLHNKHIKSTMRVKAEDLRDLITQEESSVQT